MAADSSSDPRLRILQLIDEGKISAAEGLGLLNALSGQPAPEPDPAPAAPAPTAAPRPRTQPPAAGGWRWWWLVPLGVGLAIALVGGALMAWTWRVADSRPSVWFVLALCPFVFGVGVAAVAFASRTAKWLHIRINTGAKGEAGPRRIALSLPLPIRLTAWFFRVFGRYIPRLEHTGVDELILALDETTSPDNPFYVEVDQGPDGEKVQVYLG